LVAVACRLPPAEAAQVLEEVLDKETNPITLSLVLGQVTDMAGRLPAAEVARVLGQVLTRESTADARRGLARGLAAVAGRLAPSEAARISSRAARVLEQALRKERDPYGRSNLAEALLAIAGRLAPAEAARVSEAAARVLGRDLEETTDNNLRLLNARILAIDTRHLSRREASKACAGAAKSLGAALARREDAVLADGLAILLQALDPQLAAPLSRKHAFRLCSGPGPASSIDLALTDASWPGVRRRAGAVAAGVGLGGCGPLAALAAGRAAGEPLPCRLSTPDLVELLKMPTCFGETRKVVLKHLGNRYGRTFATHWELVRFAREHHLDLDFTTPPKRPARPQGPG
jgi:hypothetical protein